MIGYSLVAKCVFSQSSNGPGVKIEGLFHRRAKGSSFVAVSMILGLEFGVP